MQNGATRVCYACTDWAAHARLDSMHPHSEGRTSNSEKSTKFVAVSSHVYIFLKKKPQQSRVCLCRKS